MAIPKTSIAATTAINSKKVAVSALNPVTTAKVAAIQASITENVSSIREAASTVNADKIKPAFGSSESGQGLGVNSATGGLSFGVGFAPGFSSKGSGSGGATGRAIESIKKPGFDEGRYNGGYAMDNPRGSKGNNETSPKDKAGDGWFNASQNQKDNLAAASAVTAGLTPVAAAAGPQAAGAVGAVSALLALLAAKATPNPDAITGTNPGYTMGKNGVSFDPLTGMGPAKIQTLGQFTGDETGRSGVLGVLMTQEGVRSVTESLSKASGSYQKNPNPMSEEPVGSPVIDDRNIKFMVGGGTAGPIMGGGNWLAGVSSASQFQLVATDALLA